MTKHSVAYDEKLSTVLGIHDGHNSAAAILNKGRIVAAMQEERITRTKNQGGIPSQAVADVLAQAREDIGEIGAVALNGAYMTYDHWDRKSLAERYERAAGLADKLKQPLKRTFIDDFYRSLKANERERKLKEIGINRTSISPVDHHMAHAAAAYYGCGWSGPVLALTCDGSGDRLSATVNIGHNGRIDRIAAVEDNDSIGRLYSMVTYLLGLMPLEHEYKLMGLAAYTGSRKIAKQQAEIFSRLFEFDPRNPIVWRRRKGIPPMYSGYRFISQLLYRKRFDMVAAGLQEFTEGFLKQWVQNCIRETGIHQVAVSGGVFMNVKANKRILELPQIERLLIFPSCGDESNSVGAAYWIHANERLKANLSPDIEPIGPIYWGRSFSDDDIENSLSKFDAKCHIGSKYVEDIETLTAETLSRGGVVARAKGRMEFGARALGNRSILASADNSQVIRVINDIIKKRDFWMPFAPAVLAERANDYYIKPKPMPAPYMTMAFDTLPDSRDKSLACQHPYDHTVRPQEVIEPWNPDLYRLIKCYEDITGEGIILNTSFNLHGSPIVYGPEDALEVFDESGLQYLALGNWWLWKE